MSALLRAELLKLRTTRTFLALAATAIALSLLIVVLIATLTEPTAEDVVEDVLYSDVSSLFILMLAVVGITGEWRHRTITSSLLAAPDRWRFLAAKVLAFAVAGLALSVAITLLTSIVGLAILSARDLPTPSFSEVAEALWRNALLAALLGAFGVGVGSLVRNQAVAVVGLILLILVIEPIVAGLWPEGGRFGPLFGAPSGLAPGEDLGFGDFDPLPEGVAVLVMLAWTAVTAGLGGLLLSRRNVD
ncbi:MAG: hypothetical protein AVDCRST_MAG30-2259 [uncultured Solirubrobacteraceae bacterium]|uniref:ABC transporter permease n=1 Tax=uncultured Solirubrobacteraceae bacterium TaxID=1162706 RepID=A0A6J4SW03_9ACTN|nr:MAG: hypothetical protein AVDCRST_MAG30-2259 [uncultured Solirubrobacteraceae bacterium]